MKILFSIFILTFALLGAWAYLGRPVRRRDDSGRSGAEERPWRRIGAAICLLVSVMFVLGVYAVDIPDHPRIYAAYWVVIMALVLWLCALAIKDVRYTRWMISQRRVERARLRSEAESSSARAEDSNP